MTSFHTSTGERRLCFFEHQPQQDVGGREHRQDAIESLSTSEKFALAGQRLREVKEKIRALDDKENGRIRQVNQRLYSRMTAEQNPERKKQWEDVYQQFRTAYGEVITRHKKDRQEVRGSVITLTPQHSLQEFRNNADNALLYVGMLEQAAIELEAFINDWAIEEETETQIPEPTPAEPVTSAPPSASPARIPKESIPDARDTIPAPTEVPSVEAAQQEKIPSTRDASHAAPKAANTDAEVAHAPSILIQQFFGPGATIENDIVTLQGGVTIEKEHVSGSLKIPEGIVEIHGHLSFANHQGVEFPRTLRKIVGDVDFGYSPSASAPTFLCHALQITGNVRIWNAWNGPTNNIDEMTAKYLQSMHHAAVQVDGKIYLKTFATRLRMQYTEYDFDDYEKYPTPVLPSTQPSEGRSTITPQATSDTVQSPVTQSPEQQQQPPAETLPKHCSRFMSLLETTENTQPQQMVAFIEELFDHLITDGKTDMYSWEVHRTRNIINRILKRWDQEQFVPNNTIQSQLHAILRVLAAYPERRAEWDYPTSLLSEALQKLIDAHTSRSPPSPPTEKPASALDPAPAPEPKAKDIKQEAEKPERAAYENATPEIKVFLDALGLQEKYRESGVIEGDIYLATAKIHDMPHGIREVKGELTITSAARITSLFPDLEKVHGGLQMRNQSITKLPEHLHSIGFLQLENNDRLTSLPSFLTVEGDAWIWDCASFKNISDSLTVNGNLHIRNCPITALPAFTVGGNLLVDKLGRNVAMSVHAVNAAKIGGNLSFMGMQPPQTFAYGLTVGGKIKMDFGGYIAIDHGSRAIQIKNDPHNAFINCTDGRAFPEYLIDAFDIREEDREQLRINYRRKFENTQIKENTPATPLPKESPAAEVTEHEPAHLPARFHEIIDLKIFSSLAVEDYEEMVKILVQHLVTEKKPLAGWEILQINTMLLGYLESLTRGKYPSSPTLKQDLQSIVDRLSTHVMPFADDPKMNMIEEFRWKLNRIP